MYIQQATGLSRDYRRQLLTAIADGTKTTEKHIVVKGELICLKKEPTIREQLAAIAELNRMDKEDRDMQRADNPPKQQNSKPQKRKNRKNQKNRQNQPNLPACSMSLPHYRKKQQEKEPAAGNTKS